MIETKTDTWLCTIDEQAFCNGECPLEMDVRGFIGALQKGNFNSAYKKYSDAVLFPRIVSLICDHPCERACVLSEGASAVAIRRLERACCNHAEEAARTDRRSSKKDKTVAVIGGGLGGFACACSLIRNGYRVELYDERETPGGSFNDEENAELKQAVDFEHGRVLQMEGLVYHSGMRVESLEGLNADAVYIATGQNGSRFGLDETHDKVTLGTSRPGVFMNSCEADGFALEPLREGIKVAAAIDGYFKTGNISGKAGVKTTKKTRLCCDAAGNRMGPRIPADIGPRVQPSSGEIYTAEEAREEAGRCLMCTCNFCLDGCEMLSYYRKNPKYTLEEVNNSVVKLSTGGLYRPKRPALKTINSCNLCGLCGELCPVDLNLSEIFLEGRQALNDMGILPPAYHDFWLRDLAFSQSESFYCALGSENCKYAFFPGCQLGGVDPDHVITGYKYLKDHMEGEVGLMLSCCGAPAYWAGNRDEQKKVKHQLSESWNNMGRPILITACNSCEKLLKEDLPEAELLSIYSIIAECGLLEGNNMDCSKVVSVFDPCSSRGSGKVQADVRSILTDLGYELSELPYHGEEAQCCGYGGHIHAVNHSLMTEIAKKRVNADEHDYVTYCINCREIFAKQGKPVIHLLDLLSEGDLNERYHRKPVHLSDNRKNREFLKKYMVSEFEEKQEQRSNMENSPVVLISEELLQRMDRDLILAEEAHQAIRHCEETSQKFIDEDTGNMIGQCRIGIMTYWVVYRREGDTFRLVSIYSHRMKIEDNKP